MRAFLLGLAIISTPVFAVENPDVQTPEQIARAREKVQADFANAVDTRRMSQAELDRIFAKYSHLDPGRDVPQDLLKIAVAYLDANKGGFPNQSFITVVDFKPRSDEYRFFLVDMQTGAVEKYHTTHGEKSDVDNYAKIFGNDVNSEMSSLGFVRTAEVYDGTYKRSLRLDGLSDTNSNIRDRAVVFHGWDDVHETNVLQGLTWGCIALDWSVKDAVLDKIKEGSLMYVGVSKN